MNKIIRTDYVVVRPKSTCRNYASREYHHLKREYAMEHWKTDKGEHMMMRELGKSNYLDAESMEKLYNEIKAGRYEIRQIMIAKKYT